MVRVRAIVRRRKYFSIAPDEIAAQGEARCTHTAQLYRTPRSEIYYLPSSEDLSRSSRITLATE